jgi:hypothetical protein
MNVGIHNLLAIFEVNDLRATAIRVHWDRTSEAMDHQGLPDHVY